MNVAICFYGITRSLKYNLPVIKKRIFDKLEDNNIKYDIYGYFFNLDEEIDREGQTTYLDNKEYKLLNTRYLWIESQSDFDERTDFTPYYRFKYDENTNKNIARSQYLLEKLTEKWENKKYTVIIYIRPDTAPLVDINIRHILNVNRRKDENICYVADHSHWNNGINDRFAFGTKSAMKIYGKRVTYLEKFFKKNLDINFLESECYLKHHLISSKVIIKKTNMFVVRIRSNGVISSRDKFLLEETKLKATKNIFNLYIIIYLIVISIFFNL